MDIARLKADSRQQRIILELEIGELRADSKRLEAGEEDEDVAIPSDSSNPTTRTIYPLKPFYAHELSDRIRKQKALDRCLENSKAIPAQVNEF